MCYRVGIQLWSILAPGSMLLVILTIMWFACKIFYCSNHLYLICLYMHFFCSSNFTLFLKFHRKKEEVVTIFDLCFFWISGTWAIPTFLGLWVRSLVNSSTSDTCTHSNSLIQLFYIVGFLCNVLCLVDDKPSYTNKKEKKKKLESFSFCCFRRYFFFVSKTFSLLILFIKMTY